MNLRSFDKILVDHFAGAGKPIDIGKGGNKMTQSHVGIVPRTIRNKAEAHSGNAPYI
ncbi:MAG: hypothetical protein JW925_05050 [Syntrophaceae bacterium]|nr:hypothetical protein [Syntrophaceae bacterium]